MDRTVFRLAVYIIVTIQSLTQYFYYKDALYQKFLSVCKMFSLTTVLKAGDPLDVINYRPISIIPHLAKLFQVYSHWRSSISVCV